MTGVQTCALPIYIRASTDGSASTSVVLHSGDILNHSGLSIGVDSNLKLNAELVGGRQLTEDRKSVV